MSKLDKIEEIYNAVLEKEAAERDDFLRQLCGDDADLRREVESLLSFEEQARSFIETPPEDIAAELFAGSDAENLVGKTLNHYRVLAVLGAGGMGEVYLAEDTRLVRRVALKILPPHYSADPQRKARFKREARAASALNHPNIITIYGIEETGELDFIATELIDGETLRERIAADILHTAEAVEIAAQVARALAAAHEAGIVHRDIKPANIMLRRDRLVKVLDFGLAKLSDYGFGIGENNAVKAGEKGRGGLTHSGTVMGTVSYMSPEQARGLPTDERTDVWSLGVVLYEMLTGDLPFTGETPSHTVVSILEKEPPVPAEMPAELRGVVLKSLDKDREKRYQTAHELLSDLQTLREDSAIHGSFGQTSRASANEHSTHLDAGEKTRGDADKTTRDGVSVSSLEYAVTQAKSHKSAAGVVAALALFVIVGLSFVAYRNFSGSRTVSANPFQSVKLDRLTAHGLTIATAVSPDGKFIVYARKDGDKQSLWLRQTAIAGDTQIVAPSGMNYKFLHFAPDGESIYFVGADGETASPALYQISTIGRNQRQIISGVNSQIAFSPDGKNIAFVRDDASEDSLMIADAQGANERILATRKFPDVYTEGVSWSPDGRQIAAATLRRRTRYAGGIAVVDVASGEEKPLALSEKEIFRVSQLAWVKDGSGLIFCRYVSPTGGRYQLQHASYPDGEIQNLTNDLSSYEDLSLTADGKTIASVQREYSMGIWVTNESDFTAATPIETKTGRDDGERGIAWTADGKIVYVSSEDEAQNIWRVDADGTNQRPLTTGSETGKVSPSLAAGSGLITFLSDLERGIYFWQMDSEGRSVRRVTEDMYSDFPAAANQDWIVYTSNKDGQYRIWKAPLAGGAAVRLTDTESMMPSLSPDGRMVAYLAREKGQPPKIAVISIDGGAPQKSFELPPTAKTDAGISWNKEAGAILFVNTLGTTSNVWQQPLDGKPPQAVTDFKEFEIAAFALKPDGKRLAVSRGARSRDAVLVRNSR